MGRTIWEKKFKSWMDLLDLSQAISPTLLGVLVGTVQLGRCKTYILT